MSSKKERSSAEEGITQAGRGITQASQETPAEAQQYAGSFDIGKLLQQIFQYQQGLGQAPSGYLTPEQQYLQQGGELGKAYYGQTLRGVQDPYAAYESQLQPSLQLTEDYINRAYQNKGLLRSGLPIESMGRAGVELAIKEAQNRMAFRGQELARGGELSQYTQGIGQQNLANLANLYSQQQGYGQQARGRAAGGAAQAASYYAYPGQAQLGSIYGREAAMYALPGQLIGAAGTAASGMYNPSRGNNIPPPAPALYG